MIKYFIAVLTLCFSLSTYAGLFDLVTSKTSDVPNCVIKGPNDKKVCDVFFDDAIESPQTYQNIKKMALGLTENDIVILHLAGNGGQGDGLVYILNALKQSKAHLVGSMEGSIASAHVFLLTACDEIQINGDGYLLFHAISGLNMVRDYCTQVSGKDRGIAVYEKCMEDYPKIVNFYNKTLDKYAAKYLTKEELTAYFAGHNVIIDSDEFKKRLK